MTVALIGVGADSNNASRCPPVYEDGRFEYIPIAEEYESVENLTFGRAEQRYNDGPLTDVFDYIEIDVDEEQNPYDVKIKEGKINEYSDIKLHHDPNFRALTFGDPGKTRSTLLELEEGDLLAFYTGLSPPDASRPKHRYLIGFWIVDRLIDFESLTADSIKEEVEQNRENAHVKRYLARNDPTHLDNLAIAQGREPGGLLNCAFRLSGGRTGGNYSLKDELEEAWNPSTSHLGGIKPAISCDITAKQFISTVGSPTTYRPSEGAVS